MTGWPTQLIGAVCMSTEQRDPRDSPAGEFQYVDIAGIDRGRKRIAVFHTLLGADAPSRARKVIRQDDILVSTVRPNLNAVAMVPEELDGAIASTGFCVLRANREHVDPRYLFYRAISTDFVRELTSKVRGANYPAVSDAEVKKLEIPVPALSEQRRIVEVLDRVDRLRRLRAEADSKADRFLPTLFLKIFGDTATNPKGWPLKPLGELGELDRGRSTHRPRNDPAILGGPYPLIQTGEVANSRGRVREFTQTYSELGLAQSRMWPAGTLCITIAANIARTGVLEFDACFPDSVVGFVPSSRTTTEYVQFLLFHLRGMLERNAPQLAQKNINLKVLRSLLVPVPPVELQRQFSSYVCEYYDSRACQTTMTPVLDRLFGYTMKQAFSGSLIHLWRGEQAGDLQEERERASE